MSLSASLPVVRRYRLSPDLELPWPPAVVPAELLQAARTATQWLATAREAAERIVREASVQAEAAARAAAIQAEEKVWRDAVDAMQSLREQREAHERDANALLARLGQACLERLRIDLEAPWPSLSSARLLIEAWRGWRVAGRAQLRVAPVDFEELSKVVGHCGEIDIIPAPDLHAGECVLDCAAGELKASFQGSLALLQRALAPANLAGMPNIQRNCPRGEHGE